jgi:nucleoside-triphosphatase THEP1
LRRAGKHVTKAATRDQKKIIDELVKFDIFTKHAHREYKKFVNVDPSLLSNLNMNSMFKWINEHKRTIYLKKTAR